MDNKAQGPFAPQGPFYIAVIAAAVVIGAVFVVFFM